MNGFAVKRTCKIDRVTIGESNISGFAFGVRFFPSLENKYISIDYPDTTNGDRNAKFSSDDDSGLCQLSETTENIRKLGEALIELADQVES